MPIKPKIAFVQDALPEVGGAEKVLEAALEVFPQAPIYTLIYRPEKFHDSPIRNQEVITSLIDRLPGGKTHHRAFLPLMPWTIQQFDLHQFDVIVSFSYAVAHGILPREDQLHLCYMHTPLRYAWRQDPRIPNGQKQLALWVAQLYFHHFRLWDRTAAARVDYFATVSNWMAGYIWRAYQREAQVIYPPVDVNAYSPRRYRKNYYVALSRLVAHKRIDLIVEAFNRLGLPLIIIGEGPERRHLEPLAKPNVTLLGWQPQARVTRLLEEAKGFIHAAEEDFGIAAVEAQAAGCPVIAFGRGGACETIREGITGEFFEKQDVNSLVQAVLRFEAHHQLYDPVSIHRYAQRFDHSRFIHSFSQLIENGWADFQRRKSGLQDKKDLYGLSIPEPIATHYEN